MGWGDLGVFGHPYIRTPSIDRLAKEGQQWTDFYVPAPVCSPSRAALLTGRHPVRTGLYGVGTPVMFPGDTRGIPHAEVTLAEALNRAYAKCAASSRFPQNEDSQYSLRHFATEQRMAENNAKMCG